MKKFLKTDKWAIHPAVVFCFLCFIVIIVLKDNMMSTSIYNISFVVLSAASICSGYILFVINKLLKNPKPKQKTDGELVAEVIGNTIASFIRVVLNEQDRRQSESKMDLKHLPIERLQELLKASENREDFETAAKIRDVLKEKKGNN